MRNTRGSRLGSRLCARFLIENHSTGMGSVGRNSMVGFWCLPTSLSAPSHGGVSHIVWFHFLWPHCAQGWALLLADRTLLSTPISCYLDVSNMWVYHKLLTCFTIIIICHTVFFSDDPPNALWWAQTQMCSFSKMVLMFPTKYIAPMSHRAYKQARAYNNMTCCVFWWWPQKSL